MLQISGSWLSLSEQRLRCLPLYSRHAVYLRWIKSHIGVLVSFRVVWVNSYSGVDVYASLRFASLRQAGLEGRDLAWQLSSNELNLSSVLRVSDKLNCVKFVG